MGLCVKTKIFGGQLKLSFAHEIIFAKKAKSILDCQGKLLDCGESWCTRDYSVI